MIIITISIILLGIGVMGFFKVAPQKGAKPCGDRLERLQKSPNYQESVFKNSVETKMDAPPFKAIKEMLSKGENRVPTHALKTLVFDKNQFVSSTENIYSWLGHSTILMKIEGKTIITDPVLRERASLFSFMGPKKFEYTNDYSFESLPEIDVVLISHDHYDHLDYKFIQHFKDKVKLFVMPLGVGSHLEEWGVDIDKIIELDWWEHTNFEGIKLTAAPARHFTGRLLNDRFKTFWCGFGIQSANTSVYFSGDSGYFDGFKEIGEKLGGFDLAFLECGQYSEYWHNIHMMPEETALAASDINAQLAVPIHWGKFKLSLHAWNESPMRFTKAAEGKEFNTFTPQIGQIFDLKNTEANFWWKE